MFREPLNAVKTRVELGAGRMAAQVAAGIAAAFAFVFAVPAAVLWYLQTDSAQVALIALAATFLALAFIAVIVTAVIAARQQRVRRESNVTSALVAALATGPMMSSLASGGTRGVGRLLRRAPLLALGGAAIAGLMLVSMGSRKDDQA